MVAVTRPTIVRHPALRDVTFDAPLFRGEQDVGGLAAMLGLMAGRTSYFEMFFVIKPTADKPTVRNDRFANPWHFASRGRHFVAVSAAGKPRRARSVQ